MNDIEELFNNQVLELKRGTLVLSVLSTLMEPLYGYSLLTKLEKSGVAVDAGTLYPLMRRLEKQGILESTWNTEESRPRKYYVISDKGKILYKRLTDEWLTMAGNLYELIKKANT